MDDTPRPLTDHLEELRRRLFWVLGTWALCAGAAGLWAQDVYELLVWPAVRVLRARGNSLIAIAPAELFFTYLKSALLVGFVASLPMTLYQAWEFVSPGLYESERRFALPFVVSTTGLFLAGALFGYFVAFPFVFEYFLSLESESIRATWSVAIVFTFLCQMYLAFGIAFELPVALFFLSAAGITSPDALRRGRRYAIVVMFVIGAILTPPDVVSQMLLSLPLVGLYEAGIWVSQFAVARTGRAAGTAIGE